MLWSLMLVNGILPDRLRTLPVVYLVGPRQTEPGRPMTSVPDTVQEDEDPLVGWVQGYQLQAHSCAAPGCTLLLFASPPRGLGSTGMQERNVLFHLRWISIVGD